MIFYALFWRSFQRSIPLSENRPGETNLLIDGNKSDAKLLLNITVAHLVIKKDHVGISHTGAFMNFTKVGNFGANSPDLVVKQIVCRDKRTLMRNMQQREHFLSHLGRVRARSRDNSLNVGVFGQVR